MRRNLLLLLMAVALLGLTGWGCTTKPGASATVIQPVPPPPPALTVHPESYQPLKPGSFARAE